VRIGHKLTLSFLAVAILVGVVGYISLFQLYTIAKPLNKDIPETIESINEASHLDGLAHFIRYYDEVLTQSARNYAFTQDKKWEQRYRGVEPKLDKIIKEAIERGDTKDKDFFSSVDKANLALVEMEYKSIELVNNGQEEDAVKILESSEYWNQKEIHEQGLRNYVRRRGAECAEALLASMEAIDLATIKAQNLIKISTLIVLTFVIIAFTLVVGIGLLVSHSISKPIARLKDATAEISKGNLNIKIETASNDEIGELAASFNDMAAKSKESYAHLEEKVQQRTREFEEELAHRSSAQSNLTKRAKETNCLYELSKLIEQPEFSIEQIFQEAAELVRSAYRYPGKTCIRITFDGKHYKTDNFEKSELSQHTDIKIRGKKAGDIEAYYLGERSENGKGPFLEEERYLLDAVAGHLGSTAESKQTAEKLRLFRNLLDRSNDCIFIKEPEWGRFLEVNQKACEVLGYTREELLKMSIKDIEESIPDDAAWAEHVKELQKKEYMAFEGRHKRKDGTTFPVETNAKFISEEKRSYVVAVVRDITERKMAEQRQTELMEQLESINRELKDFAYIVSHDLKAPLRGIKTLAKWMSTDYADKLDEDGKEQMSLLSSRVDRMHNLIDGVLQYSRVGRMKEERAQVNLNELVPEIIDTIAPPENIAITVENELPVVECGETRIMQVFQNLLSNAVKYMDKPKGKIKIGCVEEDGFWKFSVADNGPGIEERHFERIFQIFQTLSPRDEFESTGVGLTVVKKIVELYNGKIWVESKVGEGSTFFFTLPRQKMGVKNAKLEAGTVS